jgi:hypothetical protein
MATTSIPTREGSRSFRLGKKAARPNAVAFKLEKYLIPAKLPVPPSVFGRENLLGPDWGMLGNDNLGDCVWAGAAHETMLWNKEAGSVVNFSNTGVLSDYSAVTGYDPNDPQHTDNGTDMQQAASYRRGTGVIDAAGTRHKIAAYVGLQVGDFDQLVLAMYLFGAAGIGFNFPVSAWNQFDTGVPWDVVAGTPAPTDGHYVPGLGRDPDGNIVVVTWGKTQLMTRKFYETYNDETVAYLSEEMLLPGPKPKSLDGFDLDQLQADLDALKNPAAKPGLAAE